MDARVEFFRAKLKLENIEETGKWIFVSVVHQRLWAYEGEKLIKEYVCSTSAKPPSNQYGSNGTPLGLHRIFQKIGDGQPSGMAFEKREPIGVIPAATDEKGYVTSRILWLTGLEKEKNLGYECGSENRKIYIHGTNKEGEIGTRKSGGCVELTNADVIELFAWAGEKDLVLID
jgi:hypothetical protein